MPNNNLFDSDTLDSSILLGAKVSTPVRCLGKDFKANYRLAQRRQATKNINENTNV